MNTNGELGFVAVNFIDCDAEYVERFEELFATRAGAIDRIPGFRHMHVLKPQKPGDAYLIVSYWDHEENFETWTRSDEFREGHRRGFDDIRKAKEAGLEPPMRSIFKTYRILTN